MPAAVQFAPPSSVPIPPRKRWTRAECAALETAGVLQGERLELIEGELLTKMGKKRAHVNSLTLLQNWLVSVFGGEYVNPEAPIDVAPEDNPTNEPEPDLIVLTRPLRDFPVSNPQPTDLRLVVEVSDTTIAFDLTTKAKLYARAGIPEYWVLDIANRRLIVHRDPHAGRYSKVDAYNEHEAVAPLAAPSNPLTISTAFPS